MQGNFLFSIITWHGSSRNNQDGTVSFLCLGDMTWHKTAANDPSLLELASTNNIIGEPTNIIFAKIGPCFS